MAWEHSVELFYLFNLRGLWLLPNDLATALTLNNLIMGGISSWLSYKLLLLHNETSLGYRTCLLLPLLLLNCLLLRRLRYRRRLLLGWRGHHLMLPWHEVDYLCDVSTFTTLICWLHHRVLKRLVCNLLFVLVWLRLMITYRILRKSFWVNLLLLLIFYGLGNLSRVKHCLDHLLLSLLGFLNGDLREETGVSIFDLRIFDTHELSLLLRIREVLVYLFIHLLMQSDRLVVNIPWVLHASVCDSSLYRSIERLLVPLLIHVLPMIVT